MRYKVNNAQSARESLRLCERVESYNKVCLYVTLFSWVQQHRIWHAANSNFAFRNFIDFFSSAVDLQLIESTECVDREDQQYILLVLFLWRTLIERPHRLNLGCTNGPTQNSIFYVLMLCIQTH
jgi:hypothetical protein